MTIGTFEVYLAEVSLFMSVLYILNKFLLAGDTLHKVNRYLWSVTIILSFIMPFLIGYDLGLTPSATVIEDITVGFEPIGNSPDEANNYLWSILFVLLSIYVIGVVILSLHFLRLHYQLFQIVSNRSYILELSEDSADMALINRFRSYEANMGINREISYIVHDMDLSPFSWFSYVVISRNDTEAGSHEIVTHELSHIQQRHSWDLLLANLTTIILWFNPTAWLVKRSLQEVHEFCADESVIMNGINPKEYQLLLIKKSVSSRLQSISNTLNHSNLKNRITMMLKKKSPKISATKCLFIIPALMLTLSLLSSPIIARDVTAISNAKVSDNSGKNDSQSNKNEEVYLNPKTLPEFNGSGTLRDFRDWLIGAVKFPDKAANDGTNDKIVFSFIVEKNGSISNIEMLNNPDKLYAKEITRVLKNSPKWTPGKNGDEAVRTKFTVPIQFSTK